MNCLMKIGPKIRERRAERGLSQESLAEAVGTTQSTVDRIESDDFKRMPSALPKIAAVLGFSLRELGFDVEGPAPKVHRPAPQFLGELDLPVYASAEGGAGTMVINTDPIQLVPRPWYLGNVREGYAVLVVGDSMEPVFEAGDMAVVNPRLPPRRGKDIILVADEHDGGFTATIKRLIGWTEREWKLRQYNPKKDFALPRKEWPKALRVVGKYDGG